jgi:hypothetical protein
VLFSSLLYVVFDRFLSIFESMHPLGPIRRVRIYPNVAFLYIQMSHILCIDFFLGHYLYGTEIQSFILNSDWSGRIIVFQYYFAPTVIAFLFYDS